MAAIEFPWSVAHKYSPKSGKGTSFFLYSARLPPGSIKIVENRSEKRKFTRTRVMQINHHPTFIHTYHIHARISGQMGRKLENDRHYHPRANEFATTEPVLSVRIMLKIRNQFTFIWIVLFETPFAWRYQWLAYYVRCTVGVTFSAAWSEQTENNYLKSTSELRLSLNSIKLLW